MIRLIIIAGATATGKSSVALDIAQRWNGEIISCDSMQIYRGLDIGTAKTCKDEQCGISHYLQDIIDIDGNFSVAEYQKNAISCINQITLNGKIPIVVGGTGLYLDSIIYPFGLGESYSNARVREELGDKYDTDNGVSMHLELSKIDPVDAAKIHPNNRIRLIRAMEIFNITGKSKTTLAEGNSKLSYDLTMLIPNVNREVLYSRINDRVDKMFENGLLNEVKKIVETYENPFNFQSMQAIGYKEFQGYFNGEITIEEVKSLIKTNTRHYAKRQNTWFKNKYPFAIWAEISEFAEIINAKFPKR